MKFYRGFTSVGQFEAIFLLLDPYLPNILGSALINWLPREPIRQNLPSTVSKQWDQSGKLPWTVLKFLLNGPSLCKLKQ